MAAGDIPICHTHPAEINFSELLNVPGFGLEIKAHKDGFKVLWCHIADWDMVMQSA